MIFGAVKGTFLCMIFRLRSKPVLATQAAAMNCRQPGPTTRKMQGICRRDPETVIRTESAGEVPSRVGGERLDPAKTLPGDPGCILIGPILRSTRSWPTKGADMVDQPPVYESRANCGSAQANGYTLCLGVLDAKLSAVAQAPMICLPRGAQATLTITCWE